MRDTDKTGRRAGGKLSLRVLHPALHPTDACFNRLPSLIWPIRYAEPWGTLIGLITLCLDQEGGGKRQLCSSLWVDTTRSGEFGHLPKLHLSNLAVLCLSPLWGGNKWATSSPFGSAEGVGVESGGYLHQVHHSTPPLSSSSRLNERGWMTDTAPWRACGVTLATSAKGDCRHVWLTSLQFFFCLSSKETFTEQNSNSASSDISWTFPSP